MNHRFRLTAILTASGSIALAVVLVTVLIIVRGQNLTRRFTELEHSVHRVASQWEGPDSLGEEKADFPDSEFTIFDRSGHMLASSARKPQAFVEGRHKIGFNLVVGLTTDKICIVGTTSWTETEAGLKQLGVVLASLWLPLTALMAAIAWYGGGLVLRPVTELVASADRLSVGSDSSVLETTDQAEFRALATSLNQMISRIRHSAKIQEQFASDAAHELRSPLAVLRTRIETTLLNRRTESQYEDSLQMMLGQVERLSSIVETLLASARENPTQVEPLNLEVATLEIIQNWQQNSGWEESRLSIRTVEAKAVVTFEELSIVLRNFLDNAASFSPEKGEIEVRLENLKGVPRLTVRDFGLGLSAEVKEHAFERFFRADESRNRNSGGLGIGLAVVKRIVESRGGAVGFNEVETGTEVWASFLQTILNKDFLS